MSEQKSSLSSLTPEQVLDTMIEDMRHPIYYVDGWAEVLTHEDIKDMHEEAAVNIKTYSKFMVMRFEELMRYVSQHKAGNSTDISKSSE